MHLLQSIVYLNFKKISSYFIFKNWDFHNGKKLSLQSSMFSTSHYGCCSIFFLIFVKRGCSCTFSPFMFSLPWGKELSYSSFLGCQSSWHPIEPFPSGFFSNTASLPKTWLIRYKHIHFVLILSGCRGGERPSSDTVYLSSFCIFPLPLTSSNTD